VGLMGTGKTNLLNAINWCLYGEEPFLSQADNQRLPILNLATMEAADNNQQCRVTVEISTESKGANITFVRNAFIEVCKDTVNRTKNVKEEFKAFLQQEDGSNKITDGDAAREIVERFVPSGIKDFFFFDGERLDKYFKEATSQNIKNAIYQISQMNLVNRAATHLQKAISDLQKEAGQASPEIEITRKELEAAQIDLQTNIDDISQCNSQINLAKEKIEELTENLRGMPDIEQLEKERGIIKIDLKEKEELYKEKLSEKEDFLFFNGIQIMLWPNIEKSASIIRDKKNRKELPPTIDKKLLEKMLEDCKCICGRDIGTSSTEAKAINDLLATIELSSEVARELMLMENPLELAKGKINLYNQENQKLTKGVKELEINLRKIEDRISEIDKQTGGYNIAKIQTWIRERKGYEDALAQNHKKSGQLELLKTQNETKVKELKRRLDDELKKESKFQTLKNDIVFAENATKILEQANKAILEAMRKEIEDITKNKFFELHWKKESYKNIVISDDYMVSPIHTLGYECLGTLSGGEREVLALSFSIALHMVSGFDSSIVIDRPLAMVSGDTRKYVGEIFSKISRERQIILLLTPEDYSGDVRSVLEDVAGSRFDMKLSNRELELALEAR
jgi:DNA sulfur modification protein DndD